MRIPRPSATVVRRLALASVVANVGIVVTGGAVRLTGSGLGCPTVPKCTDDSWRPTSEQAGHGVIEFTNRQLTFVLSAVAIAALVAAFLQRPRRRPVFRLALLAFLGIPLQAGLGMITVLTGLNPATVAAHFLLSVAVLAVTAAFWWRARDPNDGPRRPVVRREVRGLVFGLVGVTLAVLVLGTVVTGSGPHSGDDDAHRFPFDLEMVSQLHADGVMLLVGLTIATLVVLRVTDAPRAARRAAVTLLGVELAQGAIGFVQYFTGLPAVLVGLHLLGAALTWLAVLHVLFTTEVFAPAPTTAPLAAEEREPQPA